MYLTLKSIMVTTLMLMIMTLMIITISKKSIKLSSKSTPFECGFNPMSYSRSSFSIHFFLMGVMFLIFDIEIIMVMPMILTYKMSSTSFWTVTSMIMITILILGLYLEWKNMMLEWTK